MEMNAITIPAPATSQPKVLKNAANNSDKISEDIQYLIVRSLRNERDSTVMTFMFCKKEKGGASVQQLCEKEQSSAGSDS